MSDCPICNAMMGRMCAAHKDPKQCQDDMDILDGKGVFKSILRGDVVTDDFRRDVLKDALKTSDMPEDEKKQIEAHLDSLGSEGAPKSNTSRGPIKPLSVRRAVKDSYLILRGRKVGGLE